MFIYSERERDRESACERESEHRGGRERERESQAHCTVSTERDMGFEFTKQSTGSSKGPSAFKMSVRLSSLILTLVSDQSLTHPQVADVK